MPDTTTRRVRDTAVRTSRVLRSRARRYGRRCARRVRRQWRTATPQQRQTARVAAGAGALGLAVAVTAVAATGPWDSGQRTAERERAVVQAPGSGGDHSGRGRGGPRGTGGAGAVPPVLPALKAAGSESGADGARHDTGAESRAGGAAGAAPPPTRSALADTLEPLLKGGGLGHVRTASVVDVATGRPLYEAKADTPVTPASTVKLATATAALSARGADHRIPTRAVRGSGPGEVVLVGGGDPTLSADALDGLAARTARALHGHGGHAKGAPTVRLGYDTSLFKGPRRHPIGPNDNVAAVTPLMVDEARRNGSEEGPAPRAADPSAAAARTFGRALERHGVEVRGAPAEADAPGDPSRPAKSGRLAVHRSAPLSDLVERTLTNSDNDLAEALARQTALASGRPASFEGGAQAVRGRLAKLRLPLKGVHLADGSGLDRHDKVTSSLLSHVLVRAGDPGRPALRPVLTGLPIAHFTGTLGSRYGDEKRDAGAGLVRAKTGTLTGVNTLAGTVVDADGRLLDFAFMTSGTTAPDAAQKSLDRLAAAVAGCGCHDSPSEG